MHVQTAREREREREKEKDGGRGHAGRERKRGSHVEWKRDGSIYRLLSSDAPGITFVRFAGVDDVVAHGVGVISTREGTYLPITMPLAPSSLRAHTHASTRFVVLFSPSPSLSSSFPAEEENLPHRFFIYSLRLYSRSFVRRHFAHREFRPRPPASTSPLDAHSIFTFTLICTTARVGPACIRN